MTDREAIEILQEEHQYCLEPCYVMNAIRTAISALQEREERSKPTKAWRKYSFDEWICPYCGYDKYCDTLDGSVLPPFCEECGRPLKGADEHEAN